YSGSEVHTPAAVLPTGTKLHVLRPEENEYASGHRDSGFTVLQSRETGHLRAVNTAEADPQAPFALGNIVHLQHDQTGAKIGGWAGHQVVGVVHPDGRVEGVIPDRKIAYSVFK